MTHCCHLTNNVLFELISSSIRRRAISLGWRASLELTNGSPETRHFALGCAPINGFRQRCAWVCSATVAAFLPAPKP